MLALAILGTALAGPAAELAPEAPGTPIAAFRCDRASRVVGGGSQFGTAVAGAFSGDDAAGLFDLERPLTMVLAAGADGALTMALEGAAADPTRAAEQVALFEALLVEGASMRAVGEHVRIVLPQAEAAVASGLPVVERVDAWGEPGCVMAIDAPALFGAAPPPLPLADRVGLVVARMEDPRGDHRLTLETTGLPDAVVGVLDGQGDPGFPGVSSTEVFPTVIQVHAGVGDLLRALGEVTQGPATAMAGAIADQIEGKLVGEPGILVAMGTSEQGGAIVVPMRKPRAPGRLRKVVAKVVEQVGAEATRAPGGLLSVSVAGRPPLTAGARKGLVVLAQREDVVRDVLAGRGEPWLPPAEGPYGVRLRAGEAGLSVLGVDGYVEARYADGALEVLVRPTAR